jgi:DNA-binding response OmpR family regulator
LESADLAGRSILVVEDEPLIRFDLTRRLQDAGATVLAASHLNNALDLADHPALAAGVLDFDLGSADTTLLEAHRSSNPLRLPYRASLQRVPAVALGTNHSEAVDA